MGLFIVLGGIIIYIVIGIFNIIKNYIEDYNINKEKYLQAQEDGKLVYNNTKDYFDIATGEKLIKKTDKKGNCRWYYSKNNTPLIYVPTVLYLKRYNTNKLKAKKDNKKWFIAENYWDDTIIRPERNKLLKNTYLDDYTGWNCDINEIIEWNERMRRKKAFTLLFDDSKSNINEKNYRLYKKDKQENIKQFCKDNNPINQKIYLQNNHPYQLTYIYSDATIMYSGVFDWNKDKRYEIGYYHKQWSNIKYTYLIRFKKDNNLTTENRLFADKTNNDLWTKWYAITDDQYKELSNDIYFEENYKNIIPVIKNGYYKIYSKKYISPFNAVSPESIASCGEITNVYGEFDERITTNILPAFDNKWNFIGEGLK